MDQYVGSPGHSTYSLHHLWTSSITARHLLDFMVQGKITEADAPIFHQDATPSGLLVSPSLSSPVFCRMPFLIHTYTHTRLMALCPGLPRWAGTRKVKPIWILLKQETVRGSGISWAICKSAPRSRQITMPAPHPSVFYRPDALPAAQPTVSKHWRL